MSEMSFFPFFEVIEGSGIIRLWHQQSLQSKTGHSWVQATNSNPRRKAQDPQFAQFRLKLVFRLKLGGMRQRKMLKDLAPPKKKRTFGRTWFRLKLRWQKQYSPSVIVSGLVLQAWGMRHQLPIKIPVYCVAEVFLWLMEPMCVRNVSLQVSWCQIQSDDCEVS